jgi:hypothetical protein
VEVTVDEASSTTYKKGTHRASASAVRKGASVLVLGTVDSATITATRVIVQPEARCVEEGMDPGTRLVGVGQAATRASEIMVPF